MNRLRHSKIHKAKWAIHCCCFHACSSATHQFWVEIYEFVCIQRVECVKEKSPVGPNERPANEKNMAKWQSDKRIGMYGVGRIPSIGSTGSTNWREIIVWKSTGIVAINRMWDEICWTEIVFAGCWSFCGWIIDSAGHWRWALMRPKRLEAASPNRPFRNVNDR